MQKCTYLVRLLPGFDIEPSSSPVYALFPAETHLAPKVRVFVDFLVKFFAEQSWRP
ncbi:MAG: hypothetical protein GY822_02655 [Deltaproteobacteria bacterium]|nr:hypothetical protein [Deltaproteobacteria bacterium]